MKNLLLALIFCWVSACASGATVSDVFTVFNPAGTIVGQVGVNEDGTIFGLNAAVLFPPAGAEIPTQVYYINDLTLADPLRFGFATALLESPNGPVSDVFGVVNIGAAAPVFVLGFASDSDAAPVTFPFSSSLLETGATVSATSYLAPGLRSAGYTAMFQSDGPDVPEPGAWPMMSVAVLAIFFLHSRKNFALHGVLPRF